MSLRGKFALSVSFLILLIVLGTSSSIFFSQKKFLTDYFEKDRSRIFDDFVYSCADSLSSGEERQIDHIIKTVIKVHYPFIAYAGYLSPTGTVVSRVRDPDFEESAQFRFSRADTRTAELLVVPRGETIYELAVPLLDRGAYNGTVRVGFSQRYFEEQSRVGFASVVRRIQIAAFILFIIGIGAANVLAVYLNRPIRELADAAREIGHGNLEQRVTVDRHDELGELGHSFNDMADKLKQLDQLKDSFVSSVSHELRSPLAAIDGYCEYLLKGLERGMPREKQEKGLRIVKEATTRLANFVNNILDLAKIKAGNYELHATSVSLPDLAHEIAVLFESLADIQKKKIKLEFSSDMPEIIADPEKLKQVITNLVGNALKFSPEGSSIRVGGRCVAYPREGSEGFVEVWVADSGPGIAPEDHQRIFEQFYQVKKDENNKPKGSGLGLAIVDQIVRLHQGSVRVESDLGKGTAFIVTLPVAGK